MKTNKNSNVSELGSTVTTEGQTNNVTVAEAKLTQAGLMDQVLQEGGTWPEIVARATTKAAELQIGGKYTAGLLRGHLKYRVNVQNKAWAKALVVSETGLNIKK